MILMIVMSHHSAAMVIDHLFVESTELWKARNVETSVYHLVGMVDWGVDLNLEVKGH